jgi:hypothetical protein
VPPPLPGASRRRGMRWPARRGATAGLPEGCPPPRSVLPRPCPTGFVLPTASASACADDTRATASAKCHVQSRATAAEAGGHPRRSTAMRAGQSSTRAAPRPRSRLARRGTTAGLGYVIHATQYSVIDVVALPPPLPQTSRQ